MRDTDEIKEKIDIVEFINERVPLKKTGRNFSARCPFHSEKSASFVVSPDRQIWHCFGACNIGGDIFSFVMKWENIEFPEAIVELAKLTGVKLTNRFEGNREWDTRERLLEINHLASEYYHYILTKHDVGKESRKYIEGRGISDKIVETFGIGYAPKGWRNLETFLLKKGYKDEEIEDAGLIIRGSHGWYDRFRGRIIFPLRNHRGQTVGFSGRVLDKTAKEAKYINSPETSLYHKGSLLYGLDATYENIRKTGFVVLCEGEFDVLSSYQAGISNVVAIKGTALTEDQLRLLKRFTQEIRLSLDMDLAGDAAARRSIELADQFDFTIRVVVIPSGKDLDEGIKKDEAGVKKAVKDAVPIYDFILDSAKSRYDRNDPFGIKQIARETVPFVIRISNPIVRNHYIKKLAESLGVSEESILEEMTREQKKIRSSVQDEQPEKLTPDKISRKELLEKHLLSLLIQSPNPTQSLQFMLKNITIEDISSNPIRRIVILLKDKGFSDTKNVDSYLADELLDTYNRLYLEDLGVIGNDPKAFEKEFTKTVYTLKRLFLRRKLVLLTTKLEETGTKEEKDEVRSISLELKKIEEKDNKS
jgi:DNA primase